MTKIKPRSWLCLWAALPSARSSLHLPKSKLKSLNKAKINATYLLTSLLFPHLVGMKTRMLLGWEAPVQHPLKRSLCPGPSSGCGGGGCSPKILMPGTAPTNRHKTETSTRRCSRLRSPMLSRHCTYCSVTILPTPQHPPYTRVLFSRNTFGSKIYAHLLRRKPNIQLFKQRGFTSPRVPLCSRLDTTQGRTLEASSAIASTLPSLLSQPRTAPAHKDQPPFGWEGNQEMLSANGHSVHETRPQPLLRETPRKAGSAYIRAWAAPVSSCWSTPIKPHHVLAQKELHNPNPLGFSKAAPFYFHFVGIQRFQHRSSSKVLTEFPSEGCNIKRPVNLAAVI